VVTEPHGSLLRQYVRLFAEHTVEVLDVPVHTGATPASLSDCDIWVITGSPASVNDDLDWIRTTEGIIRDAVTTETPLLGICFGHQLVARALGGRVERAAGGWGVGAQTYETVAPIEWFPEGRSSVTFLALHQDQVVEPPPDAVVWSTSDYCPVAGMTIGERAWTVQGHPEFDVDIGRTLYTSRRELLGSDAVAVAVASLDRPLSNRYVARASLRMVGAI
jgi:GMP synthase (glutamine-hydrolysing)